MLPPAQVLTSCIGTSFWMTVLAFFLRAYAQVGGRSLLPSHRKQLAFAQHDTSSLSMGALLASTHPVHTTMRACAEASASGAQQLNCSPHHILLHTR